MQVGEYYDAWKYIQLIAGARVTVLRSLLLVLDVCLVALSSPVACLHYTGSESLTDIDA